MTLTLRAYNVLFGDCLVLSWDEDDGLHHAWIDFGNFHNDRNEVFQDVYTRVLDVIPAGQGGKRHLDLVAITHRHLDHLEGFYSLRESFRRDFVIDRLWHAHVTAALDAQFSIAQQALTAVLPANARTGDGDIARIFRNNFGAGGGTTAGKMQEILARLPIAKAHAVHRTTKLTTIRPAGMKRLKIRVLAPERDSGLYLHPLQEALTSRAALDRYFQAAGRAAGGRTRGARAVADPFVLPAGRRAANSRLMRLADFARLRRELRSGGLDLLGAVDRTRNNTSLVLLLTYGSTRLLLAADAEEKSWEIMHKNKSRLSATVVKVGHHGSINASPAWSFASVLATKQAANAAVISTDPGRFTGENPVPHNSVLTGWRGRLTSATRLLRTDTKQVGDCVVVRVEG